MNALKVDLDGGKEGWFAAVSEKGIEVVDSRRTTRSILGLEDAITVAKAILAMVEPSAVAGDVLCQIEQMFEDQELAEEAAKLQERREYLAGLEDDGMHEGWWWGMSEEEYGMDIEQRIAVLENLSAIAYHKEMEELRRQSYNW